MATKMKSKEFCNMRGPFDCETIAVELKASIVYSDDSTMPRGVIRRAARLLGNSEMTLRDVLEGRIKPKLEHLHAFAIASDFHPAVTRFLEPEGSRLVVMPPVEEVGDAEREITDVILSASKAILIAREAMEDGRVSKTEYHQLRICLDDVQKQLDEANAAVERLREPKVVGINQ